MKRFDLIDGMRGYFLVFMLINHLVFAGGFWLVGNQPSPVCLR